MASPWCERRSACILRSIYLCSRRGTPQSQASIVEVDSRPTLLIHQLLLSDLRIDLTFHFASGAESAATTALDEAMKSKGKSQGGGTQMAVALVRRSLGALVVDIENARVSLEGLSQRNVSADSSGLVSLALAHYGGQASQNIMRILGSSSVLGNPAQLVKGVASGFEDIYRKDPLTGTGNLVSAECACVCDTYAHTCVRARNHYTARTDPRYGPRYQQHGQRCHQVARRRLRRHLFRQGLPGAERGPSRACVRGA